MTPRFRSIIIGFIGLFATLAEVSAHNYNDNGICTDADCSEPYQPATLQDGWYLLSNAGNVEWFSALVNQGGNNIFSWGKMVTDIDFTGVTHTPIGVSDATKFNGRFDGQGHRILNLKLRTTKDLQGFFGGLRGGGTRISNLIIDKSCQINGKQRVGGIAAFAQTITGDPIIIENCINEANITGTSTAVGGILGGSMSPHPAIHIRNCINKGIIRGSGESATIAGWLGDNSGSLVENCYNTGRLTGIDGDKRNMVRHGGSSVVRNIFDLYKNSTYTQGIKKDWVIILIIACIFGAMHCDATRFLNSAIFGAVTAYIMLKRENILLGMMIHFFQNFLCAGISLIGGALGFFTGVLIGFSKKASYWIQPFMKFIGPIPATSWSPLVLSLFTTTYQAAVFMVALAVWFPITLMTSSGIANVKNAYFEVSQTLGAGKWTQIFRVGVPAAMPSIFLGIFYATCGSFTTLVTAELLGAESGLGWYLDWQKSMMLYANVYAGLILMAVICAFVLTMVFRLKDHLLVWQKGVIKW